MKQQHLIIGIVSIVIIAVLVYMFYIRKRENFSGSYDPSTRDGLFDIGPTYEKKEEFCGSCH